MRRLSQIPFQLKIKVLFSSKVMYLGLFVLAISAILLTISISNRDFCEGRFMKEEVGKTLAVLTNYRETNTIVNNEKIYCYSYKFAVSEDTIPGQSYGTLISINLGDIVDVEYLINDINISRLKGTRNEPFPKNFLFLQIFTFLHGLTLVSYSLYDRISLLKTLKNGFEVAQTQLISELSFSKLVSKRQDSFFRFKYKYLFNSDEYKKNVFIQANSFKAKRMRFSNVIINHRNPSQAFVCEMYPQELNRLIQDQRETVMS